MSSAESARRERGLTQRLYLIDEWCDDADPEKARRLTYVVQGTTGNLYDVVFLKDFGNDWSCTCPDCSVQGNRCKHQFFVRHRVLGGDCPAEWWKNGIRRVREGTLRRGVSVEIKPHPTDKTDRRSKSVSQRPYLDEPCPICCDDMVASDDVLFCGTSCGNSMHRECFVRWCQRGRSECPYCRAAM